MGEMVFDEVALVRHGAVLEIRLDRPDKLNPISARPGGTRDQIIAAITLAETDDEIRSVLLTGAGKAFSAGGDVVGNKPRETAAEQRAFVAAGEAFHSRLRNAALPVVGAVHGLCLGAALSLASCCDIVLASDDARFGLPEGRMGLVGATALVPVVGTQWAKFLIMTGEIIDADRAVSIGLVLSVEPADRLHQRALDLAERLTRLPGEALLLNKQAIDAVADASGRAAGRTAAGGYDAVTLSNSPQATAPDGRSFREIIATEGTAGLKAARAAQYESNWLAQPTESGDDR